jgi:hypothetical protein
MESVAAFKMAYNAATSPVGRAEVVRQFKQFAINATGWEGHPKAEKAFEIAWNHANDFAGVASCLEDMHELVT